MNPKTEILKLAPSCIVYKSLSYGKKQKYSYLIHSKDIDRDLKGIGNEITLFTYSHDIDTLFKEELKSMETIEIEGSIIRSKSVYYILMSYLNVVKLDDIEFFLSAYFGIDINFDLMALINWSEIENVLGKQKSSSVEKFFNSEGITYVSADLSNFHEVKQAKDDEPLITMSSNSKDPKIQQILTIINENPPVIIDELNSIISAKKGVALGDFDPIVNNLAVLAESFPENALINLYTGLKDYEKAVFFYLNDFSSILLPILFIKGLINDSELLQMVNLINNRLVQKEFPEQYLFDLANLKEDLVKITNFLNVNKHDELYSIIDKGETKSIEFKTTLRYDIRAKHISKDREKDVLRTIAGFLNTDGGTLFIGITDDKEISGISLDGFKNSDSFLLHLHNLIQDKITPKPNRLVTSQIVNLDQEQICIVECGISDQPIFLKWENQEEFYVRTGPSTRKLGSIDMVNYVKQKYNG